MKLRSVLSGGSHWMAAMAMALSVLAPAAFGQAGRGNISGRVLDSAGATVAGAKVAITNLETNVTVSLETNETGYYEGRLLIPGVYAITAEATGFKKFTQSGVTLLAGARQVVDVKLEVGSLSESVTVTGEAPLLDVQSGSSGRTLETRDVTDLPVSGANSSYFIKLAPGIQASDPQNLYTNGNLFAYASTSSFGTAGQYAVNEYNLDGAPNIGSSRSMAFSPTVDEVGEMKIDTAGFDASVGHTLGVNVTVTSKAGTNRLHGSVRETYFNRTWEALRFFEKQLYYRNIAAARAAGNTALADQLIRRGGQPHTHEHNYGATIGGPVYVPKVFNGKNKVFFFFSYARDVFTDSAAANRTVPNTAERQGDLSGLLPLGQQYQVYDPLTVAPDPARAGHYVRLPFADNRIPQSRMWNPMLKFYLNALPLPNVNQPLNNLQYLDRNAQKYYAVTNRFDYNLSARHRFFFRWSKAHVDQHAWGVLGAGADLVSPEAYDSSVSSRWTTTGSLDWIYTIGSSAVLDTSIGATDHKRGTTVPTGSKVLPSAVGLPGYIDAKAGDLAQIPIVAFGSSSYSTLATNVSDPQHWETVQVKSALSVIRGHHTLQFGFEGRSQMTNGGPRGDASGRYTFSNSFTQKTDDGSAPANQLGLSWAAFLLGFPGSSSLQTQATFARSNPYYGWYVQDNWRLTPKLTLNLGVRIEYELGPTERYNRLLTYFDPAPTLPITAGATAAYAKNPIPQLAASSFAVQGGSIYAGVNGASRQQWQNQWMFLPRVAVAYQLTPNLVLRAGYGVFYDTLNVLNESADQTGFSRTTTANYTDNFGQTWLAGNPAAGIPPIADPFPVRADGTRFDLPLGAALGLMAKAGSGFTFMPANREHARQQRWRFGAQRQIGKSLLLEAAYVGARTASLNLNRSLSYVPQEYWTTGQVRDNAAYSALTRNVTNPFAIANFAGLRTSDPVVYQYLSTNSFFTSPTIQVNKLLSAYPHMNGLTLGSSLSQSKFHSLEFNLNRRFSRGFNVTVAYSRNYQYDRDSFDNPFDPLPSWRPSNSSRPQRLTGTAVWELPFGGRRAFLQHGVLSRVLGGFQVDLTYEAQAGALLNFGNLFYTGQLSDIGQGPRTYSQWFNTAGFQTNASLQPLAYNMRAFPTRVDGVRQQGINTWYGNVNREFSIKERLKLQLRLECLNLFNRNIVGAPNTSPTSVQFGQVTSDLGPFARWIQVQGRITF